MEQLIHSNGKKLILCSGFISFKTGLNNWILEAIKKDRIEELVIVAGYIDINSKTEGGTDFHEQKLEENKSLIKEIKDLKNTKPRTEEQERCIKEKEEEQQKIGKKHFIYPIYREWMSRNTVKSISEKFRFHRKESGYPDEKCNESIYWEKVSEAIDTAQIKGRYYCNYCKLKLFIISLHQQLYDMKIENLPISVIFTPEGDKGIKWHSKIALKVDSNRDEAISALVGSSNLTLANLPYSNGTFNSSFALEFDVFISPDIEVLTITDDSYAIVPVTPSIHNEKGILNSIYKGLKQFL
ncbi:hypothetical protein DRW41_05095 [Neobacillus piezotolerans]|uniref:Uncharacterized protein n=1 Tax=Neobacillus piezotolerans TaxID=2259171 RepID=A0A3D8GWX0_9BACI|nr:hypothetical protein [Neobacillus piezotolerans]RDU38933.1 hypothetical protein DRW41_05095 [Neobacillus piezotolerans]